MIVTLAVSLGEPEQMIRTPHGESQWEWHVPRDTVMRHPAASAVRARGRTSLGRLRSRRGEEGCLTQIGSFAD
jgi:hypothetical protein